MAVSEIIGSCELYLGDCYDILPLVSGATAIVTDPPYNCTDNQWDQEIDLERFWSLAKAAAKKNAAFCVFCMTRFAGLLWKSNQKDFRYDYVYKKPVPSGFLNARKNPLRAHELVYIFYQRFPVYNPQMRLGRPYRKKARNDSTNYSKFTPLLLINTSGERYPLSIIEAKHESLFYKKTEFERHPTQKSVAALSFLVKTYSNAGDIILDPFMGSGSTGVACVQTGRRFIGIERE
ncbi:MAG: site-specific DNA-methyltransferase [Desulfovibrio sp.]|nr:site-specific DNA-methyltransferase [Desulfovibrio sp.]